MSGSNSQKASQNRSQDELISRQLVMNRPLTICADWSLELLSVVDGIRGVVRDTARVSVTAAARLEQFWIDMYRSDSASGRSPHLWSRLDEQSLL